MPKKSKEKQLAEENRNLRIRLEELEDTLRAIRSGEVDALVISGPQGEQVYTLKGANQPYRVLVETMNEGTATVSDEGVVLYVNNRLAAMLKMPLEKITGTTMSSYIADGDLKTFDDLFKKGLKTNCKGEVALKAADGILPVQLSLSPVCNVGIDCAVIVITDLSGQKKAQEELRKYHEHLEDMVEKRTEELKQISEDLKRSNADLRQFANFASHDLKEPLQVVRGFLGLLEKRYKDKLDEKAYQMIRFSIDSAKRMQELISDLLEYSRIGRKSREFEPTDCSLILERAIFNLKVAIEESGAEVTYGRLPVITANAVQMTSLFQNLISNAVKFRGPEAPKVHISADRKGDDWLFSIRDNGIGIDPKFSEKIFTVFHRLHSPDKYPGTGIGLAICEKIAEQHGGRIWVESEPGKGSTFYFTIPEKQANR